MNGTHATGRLFVIGLGLTLLGAAAPAAPSGANEFVLTIPPGPYNNQVTFVLFIGPDAGETVTGSTLDLTWISDGTMPASDLFLEFKFTADNTSHIWSATGADFGWGSGPGTFAGSLQTSALNGVANSGFLPHSTIDLTLDRVGGGGIIGQFVDSSLTMALLPDGAPFCAGDGTGGTCPCSGGAPGAGCPNTTTGGALLSSTGNAEFGADTFGLALSGLPAGKAGLCVKGSASLNGGNGNPAGDGLLCTNPQLRSQVILSQADGTVCMSDWRGQPFGAFPGAANAGIPTYYQWWYRDPSNACSGQGFNFSNGWEVTWQP